MSESTIGFGFRMLTRLTPLQMKLAIFHEISPDFSRVFPIFSSDLLKKIWDCPQWSRQVGEAVTSLGSTLAVKLRSLVRVDDAAFGVRSLGG